jgi:hypothetical protein
MILVSFLENCFRKPLITFILADFSLPSIRDGHGVKIDNERGGNYENLVGDKMFIPQRVENDSIQIPFGYK